MLILQRKKISFGQEKDKIYGLLFDGAGLWEEYLNTILKDKFIHPENKTGKNKFYLFEDNRQPIYPDFISKDAPKKVADAKYIPLDRQDEYGENSEKATSIYYKTITYMYRFSSNEGYLFFPYSGAKSNHETDKIKEYKIVSTDGTLKKIGLEIPQSAENFKNFIETMNKNEKEFIDSIFVKK
jgi:5-methylcytosine-specific restriction endonuclease McrBC regulatory subunit McrC